MSSSAPRAASPSVSLAAGKKGALSCSAVPIALFGFNATSAMLWRIPKPKRPEGVPTLTFFVVHTPESTNEAEAADKKISDVFLDQNTKCVVSKEKNKPAPSCW